MHTQGLQPFPDFVHIATLEMDLKKQSMTGPVCVTGYLKPPAKAAKFIRFESKKKKKRRKNESRLLFSSSFSSPFLPVFRFIL